MVEDPGNRLRCDECTATSVMSKIYLYIETTLHDYLPSYPLIWAADSV